MNDQIMLLPSIRGALASGWKPFEPTESGPFGGRIIVTRGALSLTELIFNRDINLSGREES